MTISDKIELISAIKDDLKSAIESKGVLITSNTPFSSYPELIDSIGYSGDTNNSVKRERVTRNISDKINISSSTILNCTLSSGTYDDNNLTFTGTGKVSPHISNFNLSTAWEVQVKYTHKSHPDAPQAIIGNTTSRLSDYPTLYVDTNNNLQAYTGYYGTHPHYLDGSYTLIDGHTYYIKFKYNPSSGYRVEISENGWNSVFTTVLTTSNTLTSPNDDEHWLFMSVSNGYYSEGTLYLEDTKIYLNGQLWWKAVERKGEEIIL